MSKRKYRKWTKNEVIKEARALVKRYGDLPTQKEFAERGEYDFIRAVYRFTTLGELRGIIGSPKRRVEDGYWTLENTLKECRKVVRSEGELPTQKRLRELQLSSLASAIADHGGVHVIRTKLGLGEHEKERPKGYWTLEQTVKTYKQLTRELGKTPSASDLDRLGYNGMAWNICHKYGGFRAIQEKAGARSLRRVNGYWTKRRVIETCAKVVKEKGDLPTQKDLSELVRENKEYRGLVSGISKIGGLGKVRAALHLDENEGPKGNRTKRRRPQGYWTRRNILKEARAVVRTYGDLPSQDELKRMGHGDLASAICYKYDGYVKLREDLGLEVKKVERGHWSKERVLKECRRLIREHGDLPSSRKLKELGETKLDSAITRMGGYNHVRDELGLDPNYRPKGYWKEEKNVMRELRRIKKEQGLSVFPSQSQLLKLGYSALGAAIIKYHGGFNTLRVKFREKDVRVKLGSWKDINFTLEQAAKFMKQHRLEEIPSAGYLSRNGCGSLVNAVINYHGGFGAFKERLNNYLGRESEGARLERMLKDYMEGTAA